MDCSTPGLPVHHQLLEITQTHARWVGDATQPSHPLLSPSPPTFNLSQNQGLFKWVSSLHQVAKVLEVQLQYQSFQGIFRTDFLYDGLVGSPCSPRNIYIKLNIWFHSWTCHVSGSQQRHMASSCVQDRADTDISITAQGSARERYFRICLTISLFLYWGTHRSSGTWMA